MGQGPPFAHAGTQARATDDRVAHRGRGRPQQLPVSSEARRAPTAHPSVFRTAPPPRLIKARAPRACTTSATAPPRRLLGLDTPDTAEPCRPAPVSMIRPPPHGARRPRRPRGRTPSPCRFGRAARINRRSAPRRRKCMSGAASCSRDLDGERGAGSDSPEVGVERFRTVDWLVRPVSSRQRSEHLASSSS